MTRALVAGVGNIFFGDDGFANEVIRRLLADGAVPPEVQVHDFGVSTLHLTYELLNPIELLIVVDAIQRGDPPGTVSLIEPDLDVEASPACEAHAMDLGAVFAAVRAMGGTLPRTRIVACEVAELDDRIGLSEPVLSAVDRALELVGDILRKEMSS